MLHISHSISPKLSPDSLIPSLWITGLSIAAVTFYGYALASWWRW